MGIKNVIFYFLHKPEMKKLEKIKALKTQIKNSQSLINLNFEHSVLTEFSSGAKSRKCGNSHGGTCGTCFPCR